MMKLTDNEMDVLRKLYQKSGNGFASATFNGWVEWACDLSEGFIDRSDLSAHYVVFRLLNAQLAVRLIKVYALAYREIFTDAETYRLSPEVSKLLYPSKPEKPKEVEKDAVKWKDLIAAQIISDMEGTVDIDEVKTSLECLKIMQELDYDNVIFK